jgi:hypothetical protein
MRIPSTDELTQAILRMRADALIAECFGKDWYKRGDPRPLLVLRFEEFRENVGRLGIPQSVLLEGVWGGDEHFVISEHNGAWLVGYAERGSATLRSRHASLSEAREAVLKDLWSLYESAGNPCYWEHGVPAGTPYKWLA